MKLHLFRRQSVLERRTVLSRCNYLPQPVLIKPSVRLVTQAKTAQRQEGGRSAWGQGSRLNLLIENRKYMPRATAVKQHLVDNVLLSEGSSRKADTLYSFQGVVPANRADDRASYETGRFLALLLCYWQHRRILNDWNGENSSSYCGTLLKLWWDGKSRGEVT